LAVSGSVTLSFGGSGDDALDVGSLEGGGSAESGGGSSSASWDLVAGSLGLAALGVDLLVLAVGVAARDSGEVSGSWVAFLSDLDFGVTADWWDGAGGGLGVGGGLGGGGSAGSGGSSGHGSG